MMTIDQIESLLAQPYMTKADAAEAIETLREIARRLDDSTPKPKGFTVCGYYPDDDCPGCFHVQCERVEDVLDTLEADRREDYEEQGFEEDWGGPPEFVITGIFEGLHNEVSASLDVFQRCVTTPRTESIPEVEP